MKGVIIITVPLLTLSADQIEKFSIGDEQNRNIEAHHMEELFDEFIVKYKS